MILNNKLKTVKTLLLILVMIDTLTLLTVVEEFTTSLDTPTENQTNVSNREIKIELTEGNRLTQYIILEFQL